MELWDYFYCMKLMGYEVMNVNYKKVMKQVELREDIQKYKDFVNDHFDKKMVADYFKIGLKAKVFKDNRTRKVLTDKDQLFFGWEDSKYQYTLRRQPLVVRDANMELMNQAAVENMLKYQQEKNNRIKKL